MTKPGFPSKPGGLPNKVRILAIETSCDETGLALLECSGPLSAPRIKLIKSVVASQVKVHAPFGGVVPTLAKREHVKNLPVLFRKLFPKIQVKVVGTESRPEFKFQAASSPRHPSSRQGGTKDLNLPVDLITVTVGPGLEPALWMGISFAESLRNADLRGLKRGFTRINRDKATPRLTGANHLEGHLFSFLLTQKTANPKPQIPNSKPHSTFHIPHPKIFPAIALIVSGGHTILLKLESMSRWRKLGETRDDAAGEAYDKVARMLNLPYPGGPNLEKLAIYGGSTSIDFPRPMLHDKNYDFSFSGLKTSVLYCLRDANLLMHANATNGRISSIGMNSHFSHRFAADVAASFQQAVIDVLVGKTVRAAQTTGARSIILSGGVAANKALRRALGQAAKHIGCQYLVPPWKFNTDNAAMVGVAGYLAKLRHKNHPLRANGNLGI